MNINECCRVTQRPITADTAFRRKASGVTLCESSSKLVPSRRRNEVQWPPRWGRVGGLAGSKRICSGAHRVCSNRPGPADLWRRDRSSKGHAAKSSELEDCGPALMGKGARKGSYTSAAQNRSPRRVSKSSTALCNVQQKAGEQILHPEPLIV